MYEFPKDYRGTKYGTLISEELLEEVAGTSGVMEDGLDDLHYMEDELKRACKNFLPDPASLITCEELMEAYRFLKSKVC